MCDYEVLGGELQEVLEDEAEVRLLEGLVVLLGAHGLPSAGHVVVLHV